MSAILRRGMTGPDVVRLQKILNAQGFNCGTADGAFGGKTEAAVIHFQQTHIGRGGVYLNELVVPGVVGDETWWALENPTGAGQRQGFVFDVPKGLTPMREKIVRYVLGVHAKGIKEIPNGSNRGAEIDVWTGMVGKPAKDEGPPWCCLSNFAWIEGALGSMPLPRKTGSCRSAIKIASSVGRFRDVEGYEPIPGDSYVIQHEDGTGHIGVVVRSGLLHDNPKVYVVNTISGNEGNRVKAGKRVAERRSGIVGFIDWTGDSSQDWERGIQTAADSSALSTR